ncbi:hypothetical protein Nepgr_015102 [Nepenthes gracilis]|uniref:BZIP domain-containing protein n=1 Tax=Nepenthes gracilis TaxID=150966 RepID=A0AAD3XR02_NEPGR|nr:hypothetical protein Nepgr_015102 [Nepenthes gracilis]
MSRQPQLPPRSPFQKKAIACPIELNSSNLPEGDDLFTRHQKSLSQSSILEDQQQWFDDLFSDLGSNSDGIFHCHSASDSATLLDGILQQRTLTSGINNESSGHDESDSVLLESACFYGPNSPRQKANSAFSDNSVLSALSNFLARSPERYVEVNTQSSGTAHSCLDGDSSGASNDLDDEQKAEKRHPRQRSRVRKLQYIAELERTVNVFQSFESELACRISTLLQQHAALSMENSNLKQQMARLQQQKLIIDSEYKFLMKEAANLKLDLSSSSMNNARMRSGSSHGEASKVTWPMLNWGKLNLG